MPYFPLILVREKVVKDFIKQNPKAEKVLKRTKTKLLKGTMYDNEDKVSIHSKISVSAPVGRLEKLKREIVNTWFILTKM